MTEHHGMTADQRDELLFRIENEGFEYALLDYSNWEEINDTEFHRWRRKFQRARRALEELLEA